MLTILGLITGLAGPITSLVGKIVDLQAAKANAASNQEIKKIDQEIAETEARKAVLIAEAGSRVASAINASIRAAFAVCALSVVAKLTIWDRVIGSLAGCSGKENRFVEGCSIYITDPLDATTTGLIGAVTAFYFLYEWNKRR